MTDQQENREAEEIEIEGEQAEASPFDELRDLEDEDAEATEAAEPAEAQEEASGSTELAEEDEDLNTKYLRLMADFQNFRRRTEKEKSDIYAFANEKFATGLLEVIDNFERAMEHGSEADPKFAEGMQLILKQLQDVLSRNNVEEIEALGKPFDPAYHNAVMTEACEDCESGTVTKVLQKGYMLNKKVIRPAMVAVSQ